jgi:hypothetical protein
MSIKDETITELLIERAERGWLRVVAMPRTDLKGGWDVVLRLDGVYSDSFSDEEKAELIQGWEQRIQDAITAEIRQSGTGARA